MLESRPERAFISLGSNIGDRAANIIGAIRDLCQSPGLSLVAVSPLYETEPWGTSLQTWYVNGAAAFDCRLSPHQLMVALHDVEDNFGRARPYRYAPRTLDLDLILFGGRVISEPELIVPHPHFRDRRFVLVPLCDIAPGLRDPVTGLTVGALLAGCKDPGQTKELMEAEEVALAVGLVPVVGSNG